MMLTFKIVFLSSTILSLAVLLKHSGPSVTGLAESVPSLFDGVVSWLKPPYLYLVINCIIITIVAFSKLQSRFEHVASSPPPLHETFVQIHPSKHSYNDAVLKSVQPLTSSPPTPEIFRYGRNLNCFGVFGHVDARVAETERDFTVNAAAAITAAAVEEGKMELKWSDDFVISKASWTSPASNKTSAGNESSCGSAEKPHASARFSHHRRTLKTTPEGGKALLGLSKPKRQDTLETTWKTTTEGRATPLTRHLTKSDTWEMRRRHHNLQKEITPQKMKKSVTFKERSETPSSGSGKLKKESCLSHDELNRRVEAFIKKFNEEMRLQRQESLNQYKQMVNRRAH